MKSKNLILTLIIVVLFIASAVVLYNGFSSGSQDLLSGSPDVAAAQKEIVNVLPYGEKLDFSKVKERDGHAEVFRAQYQELNPAEVGISKQELVSPNFGAPATAPLVLPPGGDNPSPVRSGRTGG